VLPTLVLANESVVGFAVTFAPVAGTLPVPVSVTCCGLPLDESEITSVAVLVPAAVGLKMTPMLQLPDPCRLDPQVLLATEKSPAFVPAIVTLAIEIVVVPLLPSVTVCAALAVPTSTVPNDKLGGITVSVLIVPVPVPESGTLCDEWKPE
jgi:hypothetical protein